MNYEAKGDRGNTALTQEPAVLHSAIADSIQDFVDLTSIQLAGNIRKVYV